MKTSLPIFLAVFVALGASFGGFVAGSIAQLGSAKQAVVLNSTEVYPVQRTGDATLGLQVYRANGCAVCHTEQVRQDGMDCDVVLMGGGKNPAAVGKVLEELNCDHESTFTTNGLPKTIMARVAKEVADSAADRITTAGGKVEIHINAIGADIKRGWGVRRSVAADYLWDYPVQLGNLRAGPDLADIGGRMKDETTQFRHLYSPQAIVQGSAMPPFRYLFEIRKMNGNVPSPDAVPMAGTVPAGYEVVPTEDARNLVAYLLSLRTEVPLYEAPFTPVASAPAPAPANAPVENK